MLVGQVSGHHAGLQACCGTEHGKCHGLPSPSRAALSPCPRLLPPAQNLTPGIRSELLEERDPHGNVQVR